LNELGSEPNDYDKHFKLMADIDLSGYVYDRAVIGGDVPFDPVLQGDPFTGVFDGHGHTISHLTIDGRDKMGLFAIVGMWGNGQISGLGHVTNLGIIDANIVGSRDIGGLAGENFGRITNCFCTGQINGSSDVGGLIGRNFGSVTSSYSTGSVSGNWSVGGLVGDNFDGSISTSYSMSTTIGDQHAGGLAGRNWHGTITMCFSTGAVSGNDNVGGLVGKNSVVRGTVLGFWDTASSGVPGSAGGIGATTAEMQNAETFLDAGWDFVDETDNGTDDIWWINEGQDYPRLWWEE